MNDFEKKVVSDLNSCESKLANMKRSRISCESKISRWSFASWSFCFVFLAFVSWSWEKNDRSSETNSSTRKRFSSMRENNSRIRRVSSARKKTTCFRCASLFSIFLRTIASNVTITRRERDTIFATIRKQFVFMFFEIDRICSRRRRRQVRSKAKQRFKVRVIRDLDRQTTITSLNSLLFSFFRIAKNSIFVHHSRSFSLSRRDREREFNDKRWVTSSHRSTSYDVETSVHDS